MNNTLKLYILLKKDFLIFKGYIFAFLALLLFSCIFLFMLFYLSQKSLNEEFLFIYEFSLFLLFFVLGLSFAVYMPLNSITSEEKQRTFKVLKGLPFNNYHIFFSKLLFGYIISLAIFSFPAIIILVIKHLSSLRVPEDIPKEVVDIFSFPGFIQLTFVLFLISTISTCLYMNFQGKQIFIGIQIVFIIFMLGFLFAINIVGKDDSILYKIFFIPFSQFIRLTFLFCPLLIILCVYGGFKLFHKHRSYIKYQ